MTAVGVVGGTGSFSGYHRGTQRPLGGAFFAKRGAFVRLLQALQDLPADAHRRFLSFQVVYFKEAFGVVIPVLVAQLVAALRDQADAAPLAVADLEHLLDQFLRRGVALAA